MENPKFISGNMNVKKWNNETDILIMQRPYIVLRTVHSIQFLSSVLMDQKL